MQVERLTHADVDEVAALHRRSIDWSLTSRLGADHVRQIYAALVEQPHFFGFVCRENGKLIAFTTATLDYVSTRETLSRLYGRHLLKLGLMALARPRDLANLLESRFVLPRLYAQEDTQAEWLSLVADTREPRLGPAATVALIRQVWAAFGDAGVTLFLGQSYARNREALRKFYGRFGGEVKRALWINDFYLFHVRGAPPRAFEKTRAT